MFNALSYQLDGDIVHNFIYVSVFGWVFGMQHSENIIISFSADQFCGSPVNTQTWETMLCFSVDGGAHAVFYLIT